MTDAVYQDDEKADQLPVQEPDRHPREVHQDLMKWMEMINIADELGDETLNELGSKVKREYEIDDNSRQDWKEKSKKAMDLAMQVAETKSYPWPKASNVIYPLMTVAAIQFAARAYPAIVNGKNVVKGVAVGPDDGVPMVDPRTGQPAVGPQGPMWQEPPGAKRSRAAKVGEHMSWQLLDEQTEWEEETDKLLHILPIVGCAFRKTFFDDSLGRNSSILVPADRVVINYHAKSVESATRVTEEVMMYPHEITEAERAGIFREIQYSAEGQPDNDPDAPIKLLEQHRLFDLDKDGYPEPYVVTIHEASAQVVRVVARYDHDGVKVNQQGEIVKIDPVQYYTKYDFLPNPDGGIYGVGFGQLLRPINEAVNTTLNMMIDAGHLQVVGGGFIGKGLSMHTGNVRFVPGEYKAVNTTGAAIKDNIVKLDPPAPSTVLFQLLGQLIEAGKEISAVKDVLTGEQSQSNIPATTTLALIEQGLKTFTAIYKRVHRALKKELEKLFRLNSLHLPDYSGYRVNNEWHTITKADYAKSNGVEPYSDPSMVSDMQKMARAQFLMTFANDPWCNGREIRRRVLDAAIIEKIDDILLTQAQPNPEMLAKASEMETRSERSKAESSRDIAQAILYLTQAAKLEGDARLEYYDRVLEHFRARLDAQVGTDDGESKKPPSEGNSGGGLPKLETPPSVPSPVGLSTGLSPNSQGAGLGLPGGQTGGNLGPGVSQ